MKKDILRIVAISDTHNKINQIDIPDGDILIHAGDATGMGRVPEIEAFNQHLGTLDFDQILFTPGNHDWLFETNEAKARSLITNCTVLMDEAIEIHGLKFWFSPFSPWFHSWAFNLPRGPAIQAKWEEIPNDTDILVTHGPPYMIGDGVPREWLMADEHVGCEDLAIRIKELSILSHISGHIHEARGKVQIDDIWYINASCLDGNYQAVHKPIVIDIDLKTKQIIKVQ